MKLTTSIFLLTVLFCGCSATYQINSPLEAKKALDKKNGNVHIADSLAYEAAEFQVRGDSIGFMDKKRNMPMILSLNDITKIERTNHSAGAAQGALITIGMMSAEFSSLTEGGDGLFILGGTLLGGVLGTVVGAIVGRHDVYEFNHDSTGQLSINPNPISNQLDIKNVIKFGMESGCFFIKKSSAYRIIPGYTFGFSTGIGLYRATHGAYILGIDFAHTNLIEYNTHDYFYWNGYYKYKDGYSRRYQVSMMDVGLLPEYMFPIGKNLIGSIYLGGSVGFGSKEFTQKNTSHTIVDSTGYYYPTEYDMSEPNNSISATSITTGVRLFYKRIMMDLRYKYSSMKEVGETRNLYVQFGFVL